MYGRAVSNVVREPAKKTDDTTYYDTSTDLLGSHFVEQIWPGSERQRILGLEIFFQCRPVAQILLKHARRRLQAVQEHRLYPLVHAW